MAILYVIRHGTTTLNGNNQFRGWLNPPLDETGIDQANTVGMRLRGKGVRRVVADDLVRSHHTAVIVGAHSGVMAEIDSDLRPWNIGDLAGKDRDEYADELQALLGDRDKRPPGDGETLNEFSTRNGAAMKQYLKETGVVLVLHSSNVSDMLGEKAEDDETMQPGDIAEVDTEAKTLRVIKGGA